MRISKRGRTWPTSGLTMNLATSEWERLIARTGKREAPDFVAVDGEGIEGRYVLLAGSDGRRELLPALVRPDGIPTKDALDWLLQLRRRMPDGTRLISYGFNYDVQNILRDLSPVQWTDLTTEIPRDAPALPPLTALYDQTILHWIPRKYFQVKRGHHAAIIDDIAGFFGTSFLQALNDMGLPVPSIVAEGKAARGEFTMADLPRVIEYNAAELRCMVLLARMIARLCERMSIVPNRWYGPSVLAGDILESTSLRHWRGRDEHEWPLDVQDALRRAYFGGRIETLWLGPIKKSVYFYD